MKDEVCMQKLKNAHRDFVRVEGEGESGEGLPAPSLLTFAQSLEGKALRSPPQDQVRGGTARPSRLTGPSEPKC